MSSKSRLVRSKGKMGASPVAIGGLVENGIGLANNIGLEIADLIASTGCGNTCKTATDVVNTAGNLLNITCGNYWAMPAPRPRTAQKQALFIIDAIISWMVQQCSNPALGDAGTRCVAERTGTGCVGNCPKTCGDGTQCCCNPEIVNRLPIANDSSVYDDSANPVNLTATTGPNVIPTTQLRLNTSGAIVGESGGIVPVPTGGLPAAGVPAGSSASGHAAGSTSPHLAVIGFVLAGLVVVVLIKRRLGK
jgi:hypothetical protein